MCDKFAPVRILHISQVYRALACVLAVALYGVFDGIYWIVLLSALCGALKLRRVKKLCSLLMPLPRATPRRSNPSASALASLSAEPSLNRLHRSWTY